MTARFLEIHTLTSYPASLLNRDDAGFAKRMPFGGGTRTRVSSQCLKRHWRVYDGDHALKSIPNMPESVRSRVSFEEFVVKPLVGQGVPLETARAAARKVMGQLLGGDDKKEKQAKNTKGKKAEVEAVDDDAVESKQVTVLGRPELDYLAKLAAEACAAAGNDAGKVDGEIEKRMKEKDLRENLKALLPGSLEAGLGAALFGRMVTGDKLSRTDAAIHVAHAFTVHKQQSESDYFSAIDDLKADDGEQGSGHINASELTSGLFYGYVAIDVPLLLSNLGGDHALCGEVIERLVHMVATVSPGAKKGSTAPYAYSHLAMVEAGSAQPRTLANAFLEPVKAEGNVVKNAYRQLGEFLQDESGMYGARGQVAHAAMSADGTRFGEGKRTLADVAAWAKAQVQA
jgi:CRISPR system Cascade subunit CasC